MKTQCKYAALLFCLTLPTSNIFSLSKRKIVLGLGGIGILCYAAASTKCAKKNIKKVKRYLDRNKKERQRRKEKQQQENHTKETKNIFKQIKKILKNPPGTGWDFIQDLSKQEESLTAHRAEKEMLATPEADNLLNNTWAIWVLAIDDLFRNLSSEVKNLLFVKSIAMEQVEDFSSFEKIINNLNYKENNFNSKWEKKIKSALDKQLEKFKILHSTLNTFKKNQKLEEGEFCGFLTHMKKTKESNLKISSAWGMAQEPTFEKNNINAIEQKLNQLLESFRAEEQKKIPLPAREIFRNSHLEKKTQGAENEVIVI